MLGSLALGCTPKSAPMAEPSSPEIERAGLPELVVRAMLVATVEMPGNQAVAGGPKTKEIGPVWVFSVEHPEHGTLLIDAGYGRRTARDPHDLPGKLATNQLGLQMKTPAIELLAAQPAIGPVENVLLTHMHTDHAAGVEDFPDAKLWVSKEDWDFGQKKRGLRGTDPRPYAKHQVEHPPYDDGPWGPFDRHEDVFGDGSILLIPAPGHTPGSQMVAVNTPAKSWLFIGDVAWVDEGLQQRRPKGWLARTVLEDDWKLGVEAIVEVASLEGVDIVAGHEPEDIERLGSWPAPLR